MTPDLLYDQMIGSGCARKLVFSWGGNPGVGSLHRLRDAVERGWPRPLEIEEHSHSAMAHAYAAGAAGMPCAIFRGYRGSDLREGQPEHQVHHLPVHRRGAGGGARRIGPDVTIIHAQKADRAGNVLVEGIVGVQKEAVLAAQNGDRDGRRNRRPLRGRRHRTPSSCPRGPSTPSSLVPGGAHPSYAHGYYARDNAFYVAWDAISRDRDTFRALDSGTRDGAGA